MARMTREEYLSYAWESGDYSECDECGDIPADKYVEPDGCEVVLCSECVKRHPEVSTVD